MTTELLLNTEYPDHGLTLEGTLAWCSCGFEANMASPEEARAFGLAHIEAPQ